jgi:redox-sensitive bicupin YhaK (pirin superfamily)
MLTIRRAKERGHADHGWLNSFHTFSFADYYDPAHMGFRALRVINEDRVAEGRGFGTHGHRDMEIISYVLDGALEHKDSLGTGSVLRPGDVQRMSAGTGVRHSEFNGSDSAKVHFLQIWIQPDQNGLPPSYQEKHFEAASRRGQLRLVASPGGTDGSLTLNADAKIYAAVLEPGAALEYQLPAGRHAWIQVARGTASVNGQLLDTGDGASTATAGSISLSTTDTAELLLFDLA